MTRNVKKLLSNQSLGASIQVTELRKKNAGVTIGPDLSKPRSSIKANKRPLSPALAKRLAGL